MIVWSVFAVGGVYAWAAVPLMVAAVVLAALARPTPGASRDADARWPAVASVVRSPCSSFRYRRQR
jgi:hypothetical protein